MNNPLDQNGQHPRWTRSILLLGTLLVGGQLGAQVSLVAREKQQKSGGSATLSDTADEAASIFYFPQIANGTAGNIRLQTTLIFVNTGRTPQSNSSSATPRATRDGTHDGHQ